MTLRTKLESGEDAVVMFSSREGAEAYRSEQPSARRGRVEGLTKHETVALLRAAMRQGTRWLVSRPEPKGAFGVTEIKVFLEFEQRESCE